MKNKNWVMSSLRSGGAAVGMLSAVVVLPFAAPLLRAQQATTVDVHGHVQNAAGFPQNKGDVKFTTQRTGDEKDQKFAFAFPIGANGDYSGQVAPGDYFAYVIVDGKRVDRMEVDAKPGDAAKTVDFDMTRKEYFDKLTPEEKAQIEEYKKNTGATLKSNAVVAQLNTTLKTVRDDLKAAGPTHGDVSKDVDLMQQATAAKPDESILWIQYGDALQAQGDHVVQMDKDAKKPWQTDADATKLYSEAADDYKKGAELNAASKKPSPADQAVAYNQMGNLLAKTGKTADAVAAFDQAAKIDPAKAGMYYGNEAANLFNAGSTKEAADAATKAIAADPSKPDPYFIRGQALISQATVVNGKIVAPPECIEAYQKYLELAPEGKFAPQVKEILAGMGQSVTTKYKAGRK